MGDFCATFRLLRTDRTVCHFSRDKTSTLVPAFAFGKPIHHIPPHPHPTLTPPSPPPRTRLRTTIHTHIHALCCLVTITKVRKIPDRFRTVVPEAFLHVNRRGESGLSKTVRGRPLPFSSSLICGEMVACCHGMLVSSSFRKQHMMCSFYQVGKSIFNVLMAVFSFSLQLQDEAESRRRSKEERCQIKPIACQDMYPAYSRLAP